MSKKTQFIWYAQHPKAGDLTLVIEPENHFKFGFLYSPAIVADRLRGYVNPMVAMELGTGPCGIIPRRFYDEAGFMVQVPFRVRMIAIMDQTDKGAAERHEQELSAYMTRAWEERKVYEEA